MSLSPRQSPVWVTATGAITCAGATPQTLWQNAFADRSGIQNGLGKVTEDLLTAMREQTLHSSFRSSLDLLFSGLPASKAVLMATYALTEALQASSSSPSLSDRDGIILATTTGQIPVWDQSLLRYLRKEISVREFENVFQHQPLGSLLEALSQILGFRGRSLLISSACTAATQAIAIGCHWIRQGRVKRCFVGGTEILCDLTVQGFKSLQLLSEIPAAPFDKNRTGINLSEGAGFLCLEAEPGPHPLAVVSGSGLSTDSYHMTAPHPEGRGSLEAMQGALEMAGLQPSDISWVHAHGTGSQHNDLAEGNAIRQLFHGKMPWVSSTKWVHGHALGASGALETILCIEALKNKTILRTAGLKTPDPQIEVPHPSQHLHTNLNHILKNTLGFGGINASLVISKAEKGSV